jgi:hypothetical protein
VFLTLCVWTHNLTSVPHVVWVQLGSSGSLHGAQYTVNGQPFTITCPNTSLLLQRCAAGPPSAAHRAHVLVYHGGPVLVAAVSNARLCDVDGDAVLARLQAAAAAVTAQYTPCEKSVLQGDGDGYR